MTASQRTSSAVRKGAESKLVNVAGWVPRGSVLWPIVFQIHTNNIYDTVYTDIVKFAGDTRLFGWGKTWEQAFSRQGSLKSVLSWKLNDHAIQSQYIQSTSCWETDSKHIYSMIGIPQGHMS